MRVRACWTRYQRLPWKAFGLYLASLAALFVVLLFPWQEPTVVPAGTNHPGQALGIGTQPGPSRPLGVIRLSPQWWEHVLSLGWPAFGDPAAVANPIHVSRRQLVDWFTWLAVDVRFSAPVSLLQHEMPWFPAHEPESGTPGDYRIGPSPDFTANTEVMGASPLVLIYHTHATESFVGLLPSGTDPDNAFTTDRNRNMVMVGDVLARTMHNRYGINLVHLRSEFDLNGRLSAYERSYTGVVQALQTYPSLQMLIDVHRDAGSKPVVADIGGQQVAKVLFVVGSDKRLPHPHWQQNLTFARLLAKRLDRLYPGILAGGDGIMVEDWRYNQHLSPGAILIEIGNQRNSLDEELRTARLLAPFLADVVKRGLVPIRPPLAQVIREGQGTP